MVSVANGQICGLTDCLSLSTASAYGNMPEQPCAEGCQAWPLPLWDGQAQRMHDGGSYMQLLHAAALTQDMHRVPLSSQITEVQARSGGSQAQPLAMQAHLLNSQAELSGVQPLGIHSQPLHGTPLPQGSTIHPLSFQSQPLGSQVQPQGSQAQPTGSQMQPEGMQAQPLGNQAQDLGIQSPPLALHSQPLGVQAQPYGTHALGIPIQPQGVQPQPFSIGHHFALETFTVERMTEAIKTMDSILQPDTPEQHEGMLTNAFFGSPCSPSGTEHFFSRLKLLTC